MKSALPRVVLGGMSGLLLVLSLPKPDYHFLAWIALVPLLVAAPSHKTYAQAAVAGYAAGVVYFAGTCYWIGETMTIYGGLGRASSAAVVVLFVAAMAGFFAAFGAALHYFVRRSPPVQALLLAPPLWVSFELLRTHVPFGGFPWMLSGYALVPYPGILQIAAWAGIYSLSFIAVLANTLVAAAIADRNVKAMAGALAIIAVAWLLPAPSAADGGSAVHVRIVQPNLAFEQSWEPAVADAVFEELTALSRMNQSPPGESRLIVWPESAGPFFLAEDALFRDRMQKIAVDNRAHFLFGYVGTTGDMPANSAAVIDPAGVVLSRYDKIHLVPFGEYVPLRSALFFAEGLLEQAGNFAAGADYTVSIVDNHPIATAICYESIFPGLVREFVSFGSELIAVITNDGWFGESSAPYQHLRMAIVRAVENRRFVVRSANTGVSAIIDPYGRVLAETPMHVRTALDGIVRFRADQSFYTQFGDVFAWLNVLTLGASAFYAKGRFHVRRTD